MNFRPWLRALANRLLSGPGPSSRRTKAGKPRKHRPCLEALEARWLPSTGQTFIVNDVGNPTPTTGTLTLAQAISLVDADTGVGLRDTIQFNIPGSANQVQTINIANTSPLPAVTQPVLIDGWSEGNFENSSTTYQGPPLIVLHGDNSGSVDGLDFSGSSAGSTVQGLVINNFSGTGIGLSSSGNLLQGNYIGTDVHGTTAIANGKDGVLISSSGNTIGGAAASAANLLSGNSTNGVEIGGSGNLVLGNSIGTDVHGTTALANGNDGVLISASGNTVGGSAGSISFETAGLFVPGPSFSGVGGNLISGNTTNGVEVQASGNLVLGNSIGTDVHGTAAIANGNDGVLISASGNTVGGSAASIVFANVSQFAPIPIFSGGGGNVISGNTKNGVEIQASGNLVLGNSIGTDVNGTAAIANGNDGVLISASGNTVGGSAGLIVFANVGQFAPSASFSSGGGGGNLISGNTKNGVEIQGSGNLVLGNSIGTDVHGTASLGNSKEGVLISNSSANTIGGGNLISGNGGDGVQINGLMFGATGNMVLGNSIGTDIHGTTALANSVGVRLYDASVNTVGGTTAGAGNLISGNKDDGVAIYSGTPVILTGNNLVVGNSIGTDVHGATALANGGDGVSIATSGNTVGGMAAGAGNLISGNILNGVEIQASGNLVLGNTIGTDLACVAAVDNGLDGVLLSAPANTVGAGNIITAIGHSGVDVANGATFSVLTANTISGNTSGNGVLISAAGSAKVLNNSITGNHRGVDVSGGIALLQGNDLSNNTVGGAYATGLVAENGAIVDAGQLAASATPLPNGPAGNVGYYGDITGLLSGTPLGSTAHSSGNNSFNGYTLDPTGTAGGSATIFPGSGVPQAIRDLNIGTAPFGPVANGVEQSFNYGAAGSQFGRMDLTAQNNSFGTTSLFQIEQLIFHDIDRNALGFVTYGTPTAASPVVVGPVTYYAANPLVLTDPVVNGRGTLVAGSMQGVEQMSAIRFIEVTFSSYVFLAPSSRGLGLVKVNGPYGAGPNTQIQVTIASAVYNQGNGNYTVIYAFRGPGTEFGSLEDGNYSLQFNESAIQGGGPGGPGLAAAGDPFAAAAAQFHRFFGDVNGDGLVDNTDLAAFQAAYRSRLGMPSYRAYLDFDFNSFVDASDNYQFLRRYKMMLNANGSVSPLGAMPLVRPGFASPHG